MEKIKVVFLGSRHLGFDALEMLSLLPNVEIVGCVTKEKPENCWWSRDPHQLSSKYRKISHDELDDIEFDFGVSINYWKIINSNIINKPKLGFINLHHSYNLCLRGRDMNSHVIRRARSTGVWYHGTSLHYTDDGLDTGPIIAAESCEINEHDTAWSVFNKVESLGHHILKIWLPRLIQAKAACASPQNDHPLFLRGDDSKLVDYQTVNTLKSYDYIRSCDFNNYYEPAYTLIDDNKVYLTTNKEYGGDLMFDLALGRQIFSNPCYTAKK